MIADDLVRTSEVSRTVAVWDELSWVRAAACTPQGKIADDGAVKAAVARMARWAGWIAAFRCTDRKSEQIDVDFLSDPAPL